MRAFSYLSAIGLFCLLLLVGCGGGGGSSAPTTYDISGTITSAGVALQGVTVTLSGGATTTTDASGNYSFTGLANGSYTVTPSLSGDTFSPISYAATVSGANVTEDFTATASVATTYSISGTVTGASAAILTLSNGPSSGSVVAGSGGSYSFTGLVAGTYTVTPSLSGYNFTPGYLSVTLSTTNSTGDDFTAAAIPVPHSISGTVSGAVQSGVTITVTETAGGTANATTTTAANGTYTVTGLYDGTYTVQPSASGYTFSPPSTSVTLSGANVTAPTFTSSVYTAPTYSLSGTVSGVWGEDVTITLGGNSSATTATNASGNYSFSGLAAGTYTVTPSLPGYTYSPAGPTSVTIPSTSASGNATQNFTASSAIASYSISGTVTNGSSSPNTAVEVWVQDAACSSNCLPIGEVELSAPGAYTIRGLQSGMSYVVAAEMDTVGSGYPNANNPIGIYGSPSAVTIGTSNVTGISITLTDPSAPASTAPTVGVVPGNASALIKYSPQTDSYGQETGTQYKLYWSTDNFTTTAGTVTLNANGMSNSFYMLTGLTDGDSLSVKMSTIINGVEGTVGAASSPVTIGASTGASTVSGTVTFPGTAKGAMMVAVFNGSTQQIYMTVINNPVSPQSFSIAGVPNGDYRFATVIDMNGDGVPDAGDIIDANDAAPAVTVNGNITGVSLTLTGAAGSASLFTDHWSDGPTNNSYSVIPELLDGTKHIVAATLFSGPNIAVPFDTANLNDDQYAITTGTTSPAVGDTYLFKVTYQDGTTGIVSAQVTGVLGTGAFATSLGTNTASSGLTTVPTFTWGPPSSPPANYGYSLSVNGITDNVHWDYPGNCCLPSTTTSATFDSDGNASGTMTSGNTYNWSVQVHDYSTRNTATYQSTYSVP